MFVFSTKNIYNSKNKGKTDDKFNKNIKMMQTKFIEMVKTQV
jgi:hypothetical protein